jgi:hypothetical protein
MAHSISRSSPSARQGHGALPVVLFFVAALALAVFAIGYLAFSGPQRLAVQSLELRLPKAPTPSPVPNPQPLPSPLPRPG